MWWPGVGKVSECCVVQFVDLGVETITCIDEPYCLSYLLQEECAQHERQPHPAQSWREPAAVSSLMMLSTALAMIHLTDIDGVS